VTLNVPRSGSQYVGRVHLGALCRIGTVVRVMGGMYYADEDGIERFTSRYEVLTCRVPPATTTVAPPPVCRE
jgi:hypothetical protein